MAAPVLAAYDTIFRTLTDSVASYKRKISVIKRLEEILQQKRDELLQEKVKLTPLQLLTDDEILKSVAHVVSIDRGREILKIVQEIHEYELEILELNSHLQQQKIESECKELQDAFCLASTPFQSTELSNQTNLHKWYFQIKELQPQDLDDVNIHSVNFRKTKKSNTNYEEELHFSVSYSGATLHITIKCTSKLSKQEERATWEIHDCAVLSDIDSQELRTRGKHLLKFGRPIRMFIHEITDFMSSSVIAYV